MKSRYSVAVLVLTIACSSSTAFAADDAKTLERILNDWRMRRTQVDGISYEATGKLFVKKGCFAGFPGVKKGEMCPAEDRVSDIAVRVSIDFKNGRLKWERDWDTFGFPHKEWFRSVDKRLYDGSVFQVYTSWPDRPGSQPFLELRRPTAAGRSLSDALNFPWLFVHGMIHSYDPTFGLSFHFDKEKLRLRRIGGREEAAVVRVRSESPRDGEFWIDTERQSAVTRFVSDSFCDISIEYQKKMPGWLLKSWTYKEIRGKAVIRTIECNVTNITINPEFADNEFRITPTIEMRVADGR